MKRRQFFKTSLLGTAAVSAPFILPSGRLFAKTQDLKAQHVVLVIFGGGIRQQESVLQRYLSGSQNEDIPGNILPNLFSGPLPEEKIAFGLDGNREGEIPIEKVLNRSIQAEGVLFKEMRTTHVAHFGGLNVCLQGTDFTTQGLKQRPVFPTVFEYIRRHGGFPARKVWFIGSGIGNSVPLLNSSEHQEYGLAYGANFLAPSIAFAEGGIDHLSLSESFHPEYEMDPVSKMKFFLDNRFERIPEKIVGVQNTDEEQEEIHSFLIRLYEKQRNFQLIQPRVRDNPDLQTIGYTCEVLAQFKPALTVVNLENPDICHSNFTEYLKQLHRADHAVGFLWDYIQREIPDMADETILLIAPECGRNLNPNPIRDENDWFAYDHSDENAHRIFGMMVGKGVPEGLEIGDESRPIGMNADLVPTIADILGIKDQVMGAGYLHPDARSWFDRI